jgi:hypothetical protein
VVTDPADAMAGWTAIDAIAVGAFGKDAGIVSNGEWSELAVRLVAGEFDPAPARPRRRATTTKEST